MKRFIFLSLLSILFFATSSAQKKDDVTGALLIKTTKTKEVQPAPEPVPTPAPATNINKNLFLMGEVGLMVGTVGVGHDFMFTAGYRFKERFVVGGGLGYFGAYSVSGTIGMPLYAYGRVDILKDRKTTPFVSFYLGGNIPDGVYVSPMIGIRLPISQNLKFNISTGYIAASTIHDGGDYPYVSSNWSLRIGVEF